MAKPILKWRKRGRERRSGPFSVTPANNGYYLKFDGGYCNGAFPFASDTYAMAEAERLARKIITATK